MVVAEMELTEGQASIGERLQRLADVPGVRDAMRSAVAKFFQHRVQMVPIPRPYSRAAAWLEAKYYGPGHADLAEVTSIPRPFPIDFDGPTDNPLFVLAAASESFNARANIKPEAFAFNGNDTREAQWDLLVKSIRRNWKDGDERFGHLRAIVDEQEARHPVAQKTRGRRADRLEAIEKIGKVLLQEMKDEKARRDFAANRQGRIPEPCDPLTQKEIAQKGGVTEERLSRALKDPQGETTASRLEQLNEYRHTGREPGSAA